MQFFKSLLIIDINVIINFFSHDHFFLNGIVALILNALYNLNKGLNALSVTLFSFTKLGTSTCRYEVKEWRMNLHILSLRCQARWRINQRDTHQCLKSGSIPNK